MPTPYTPLCRSTFDGSSIDPRHSYHKLCVGTAPGRTDFKMYDEITAMLGHSHVELLKRWVAMAAAARRRPAGSHNPASHIHSNGSHKLAPPRPTIIMMVMRSGACVHGTHQGNQRGGTAPPTAGAHSPCCPPPRSPPACPPSDIEGHESKVLGGWKEWTRALPAQMVMELHFHTVEEQHELASTVPRSLPQMSLLFLHLANLGYAPIFRWEGCTPGGLLLHLYLPLCIACGGLLVSQHPSAHALKP